MQRPTSGSTGGFGTPHLWIPTAHERYFRYCFPWRRSFALGWRHGSVGGRHPNPRRTWRYVHRPVIIWLHSHVVQLASGSFGIEPSRFSIIQKKYKGIFDRSRLVTWEIPNDSLDERTLRFVWLCWQPSSQSIRLDLLVSSPSAADRIKDWIWRSEMSIPCFPMLCVNTTPTVSSHESIFVSGMSNIRLR